MFLIALLVFDSQIVLVVKNSPAKPGDLREAGWIPRSRRFPGGGHSNSFQYSCLENPYGQRSLAGYTPGSRKSQTRLSD